SSKRSERRRSPGISLKCFSKFACFQIFSKSWTNPFWMLGGNVENCPCLRVTFSSPFCNEIARKRSCTRANRSDLLLEEALPSAFTAVLDKEILSIEIAIIKAILYHNRN